MSTNLYWSPLPEQPKERSIYSLKWNLAKKLGSYDGSIGENLGDVGAELIPYLEGIIAGNSDGEMSKDAQSLIDAINKYGTVSLNIY